MKIDVITIFPKIFSEYINTSILGRAQSRGIMEFKAHDLRNFTFDKHKTVDDKPYGGGAGMVLTAEPIIAAVDSLKKASKGKKTKVILFSAKGKPFNQKQARTWSKLDHLISICGRYEGIDERVKKIVRAEEVSIGPYVLTDGDVAAMVVASSITRLIPGVITFESLQEESHWNKLLHSEGKHIDKQGLEYPHYTRPEVIVYKGKKYRVPQVLLSGNHSKIDQWRKDHIS